MAKYFSGPSTAQMRLTVFLIGAAALVGGVLTAIYEGRVNLTSIYGGFSTQSCGTPFAPRDSEPSFPNLAEACYPVIIPWQIAGIILFIVAGIFLIRLLYMLIGPKIPSY
jgi:hypothetical protein